MENLHAKHIRRWVCLLTIFAGFSIQTGFSTPLISACDASTTSSKGMDPVIFSFGCIDGEPGDTICCLLYTSDAADERSSVDLGGWRRELHPTASRFWLIFTLFN